MSSMTQREFRSLQVLQVAFLGALLFATTPLLGSGRLIYRFAVAFGGAAVVLVRGWGMRPSRYPLTLVLAVLFPVLCLASVLWSWATLLTLSKAALLAAVFLVGSIGGFEMGRRARSDEELLWPWAVIGVLWVVATIYARGSGFSSGYTGFRGATGNENMFAAASAAIAFPLSEYLIASRWSRYRAVALIAHASPWVWCALILASRSRGGLTLFAVVAGAWWWSVGPRRRYSWLVPIGIGVGAMAIAYDVKPVSARVESIVYKQEAAGRDLFYSRRENWLATEAAIALVGPLGAGLGVAADQPFRNADISWTTTVGYGREHGSSWLALREQLGVPGQAVFALLAGGILISVLKAGTLARRGAGGVGAPLLFATALGLQAQSLIEAWIVAPGSAESGLFWAALGHAAGAYSRSRDLKRLQEERRAITTKRAA